MKRAAKDIVDKCWGSGKCDISSVLNMIESSNAVFDKDDVLDIYNSLFSKQGLSSTPNQLATLIFCLSKLYTVHSVIDICCGTGNILSYFKIQKAIGIDVNANVLEIARKLNPEIEFITADSLSYDFKNNFDLVVGSLPFGLKINGKTPIEVELIKKGLTLLNPEGVAIFVVPDGLLSLESFSDFRKNLLSSYAIDMVISLQTGLFYPFTFLKTSLLVIRNGRPNEDIFMGEYKGDATDLTNSFKNTKGNFFISRSKIENRLDRNYYVNIDLIEERLRGKEVRKLGDIAEIIRGPFINKEQVKTTGRFAIFNKQDKAGNQLFIDDLKDEKALLKHNDIVIPIIGENKLYVHKEDGKEWIITQNFAIIRSTNNTYISTYLQTPDGQDLWKKQADRIMVGLSLSHISILSLKNILIPILPLSDLNFLDEDYLKNASLQNLYKLEGNLKQLIAQYQEKSLHQNFSKEILRILQAQEERTKRIEAKVDNVNSKIDSVLSALVELNNDLSKIKNNKRDDEEKISRMYFDIDNKLSELIKEQTNNIQFYQDEIKKWLDDWSLLHSSSSSFLTSAELIFDHLPATNDTDYSPFIIQYCRALENEILKKLFEAYHIHLMSKGIDRKALVAADKEDEKTSLFAKFVEKDRRDYTLGNMNMIMNLLKDGGKTLKNSPLLQNFRTFTLNYFEEKIIQKEFLDTINNITSNYRNKSAHPYILTLEVAKECQHLIREILSVFLKNYKGSVVIT
jgi:SAM-dependent methyltransferase